ncbi:hypothetical protein [Roseateles sp. LYH14W]|uniref:DUF4398 domain-containing protein n=1 Tax=Pelomonas parva TaxID=3299032 RepID=A0ABW7F0X5_9BURK
MKRTVVITAWAFVAVGCASTPMKDPGLTAEADRSEQRAIAAQKDGMREVARLQDARADRLRAQAGNQSLGDVIASTLINLLSGGSTKEPERHR